ncbi:DUF4402 domain-containing protein, partial [Gammaproteobacteria bacterium]|nr:DUF4402 domain-containing protein [Gammaproteobacteria bacterium]
MKQAKPLPTYLFSATLFCCVDAAAQSGSSDPEFDGNAGAVMVNGLRVIARQHLDFGSIAASDSAAGTVKTLRGGNNRSECAAVLTCLKPGNRARFTVIGEPYRWVTISDPGTIYLNDGGGNSMLVTDFTGAGSGNDTEWRGQQRLRPGG